MSRIGTIRKAMLGLRLAIFLFGAAASAASAQTVIRIPSPVTLAPLPMHVGGRVGDEGDGMLRRQWPGTYFETAISGSSALFRIGEGKVSLRISADGGKPVALVEPAAGLYRIGDLGPGTHRLRVQVASESQDGPSTFGGFFATMGTTAAPLTPGVRQIEFIGDSHTVGYGNTSATRQCTEDEIWTTTDTTLGVPALVGAHYGADYQVNAISGRGIVRNYNGFAADPLPKVYPYVLFDKARPYADAAWHPRLILISLGTNDFSTPLNAGERWASREALRSDYEATFIRFVSALHQRNPNARFLFWAANPSDEISAEIGKVVARVSAAGIANLGYVPVEGLAMTACNWHPSTADDRKIAAAIERKIDSDPSLWAANGDRG